MVYLLNVVDKDGQELYETFILLEKVIEAFKARCVPVVNVVYERCMFNKCKKRRPLITDVLMLRIDLKDLIKEVA